MGSRNSLSHPDNFAVPFATGNLFFSPLWRLYFFCIDSSWMDFRCVHLSNSSLSATIMSPFQIPLRSTHFRRIIQVKRSCQIGEALTGLVKKSDDIQPWHPKGITGPLNGSPHRIAYRGEFSCLPGSLEHFADVHSIPQNQPTISHPSPIATVQQTSHLLFCVPLSQQYHSSRIDEVFRFDDFMITLQKICQIPMELSV